MPRSDLHNFDAYYGLPDFGGSGPTFTKLDENGGTNYPSTQPGGSNWEQEEALDVEWAHAIAPQANIVLIEASSASYSGLDFDGRYYGLQSPGSLGGFHEFHQPRLLFRRLLRPCLRNTQRSYGDHLPGRFRRLGRAGRLSGLFAGCRGRRRHVAYSKRRQLWQRSGLERKRRRSQRHRIAAELPAGLGDPQWQ